MSLCDVLATGCMDLYLSNVEKMCLRMTSTELSDLYPEIYTIHIQNNSEEERECFSSPSMIEFMKPPLFLTKALHIIQSDNCDAFRYFVQHSSYFKIEESYTMRCISYWVLANYAIEMNAYNVMEYLLSINTLKSNSEIYIYESLLQKCL